MTRAKSEVLRRKDASVLLVCRDAAMLNRLKQSLNSLGYPNVSTTNNHGQGLERIRARRFSLVFFDAVESNMTAAEFVNSVTNIEEHAKLIALSARPSIDQVFDLLRGGARWFLVLPFTVDALDDVIVKALRGPPFSEGVFQATDRNAALVSIILNTLEDLSATMRHLRSFPEAPLDAASYQKSFTEAVGLAKTFAEGGNDLLRDKICDACLARAMNASTRLGRVRKRLQKLRNGSIVSTGRKKRKVHTSSPA